MRPARLTLFLASAVFIIPACRASDSAVPTPQQIVRAADSISADQIRAHMTFLADDLLEGRETGSRGYDLAAAYVSSAFDALGLEPGGDGGTFFQRVPFRRSQIIPDDSSLRFLKNGTVQTLKYGVDYVARPEFQRTRSSVDAPLVFVAYGVTAPELHHDDYGQIDARGKIVVIVRGAPETFPHDERAYYSSTLVKIKNAADHGAVGMFWVRTAQQEKRSSFDRFARASEGGALQWVDSQGNVSGMNAQIVFQATLSPSGLSTILSGAVKPLYEMLESAKRGEVVSFNLVGRVQAVETSRHAALSSTNVVAILRGADPFLKNEFVVITAHLDHLGVGDAVNGDTIYNGAYDNASGVSSMLEVARALASLSRRPARSVMFIALTGEEKGLQGSDYFVAHPTVPLSSIVADVNLDMFLTLYRVQDVVAFGGEHSSLGEVVDRAAREVGWKMSPDYNPSEALFVRSDQFSFVKRGVPSVFLVSGLETGSPGIKGRELNDAWIASKYHSRGDDLSQSFDFPSMVNFARLNLLITWSVADTPERPHWNADDFFGRRFGKNNVMP
ncbi:MAG: M28 family metallopeptidase [Acidobacteriota bacterium]